MVIDTNVLVSILIDPNGARLDFVTSNHFYAPNLLKLELQNVMRKYHTLEGLPLEVAKLYFEKGLAIVNRFFDESELLDQAIVYSYELNHPTYDCIYLSLASKLNTSFVSNDGRLLNKATNLGVRTLHFDKIIQ